jgi:hypothetical protein
MGSTFFDNFMMLGGSAISHSPACGCSVIPGSGQLSGSVCFSVEARAFKPVHDSENCTTLKTGKYRYANRGTFLAQCRQLGNKNEHSQM